MSNNIENNIKKTFQNREIQPSDNAWNKLANKLEVASLKKKKNTYKYLAYAAIMIGIFLGIFTVVNKTEINNKPKHIVIEKKQEIMIPSKHNKMESLDKLKDTKHIAIQEKTTQKNNTPSNPNIRKKRTKITQKIKKTTKQEGLALLSEKKDSKIITANTTQKNKVFEKKEMLSSDDDIDKLLANALGQTEPTSIKEVNIALDVLEKSTESNLKKPLKYKIIETIKTGVDTVETLVVSNN